MWQKLYPTTSALADDVLTRRRLPAPEVYEPAATYLFVLMDLFHVLDFKYRFQNEIYTKSTDLNMMFFPSHESFGEETMLSQSVNLFVDGSDE